MKRLILAFVLLITGLSGAVAGDLGERLEKAARFYGVGWQSDGNHWSIDLFLSAREGHIAYPSLDCTGQWTRIGQGLDSLIYREQITENTNICIEFGDVSIEALDGDRLLYTWREQGGGPVVARAVLRPVGGAKRPYMDMLMETLNTVELDYLLPEFFR